MRNATARSWALLYSMRKALRRVERSDSPPLRKRSMVSGASWSSMSPPGIW